MDDGWWDRSNPGELRQGQLLERFEMPLLRPLENANSSEDGRERVGVEIREGRGIVLTQSCDLVSKDGPFVTVCRVYTAHEFAAAQDGYGFDPPTNGTRSKWEDIRRGKVVNAHLVRSPFASPPLDPGAVLVVDFRQVLTIPRAAAAEQVTSETHRLRSPYLEHFSQAFARSFMRVGLPSDLPSFKAR